MDRRPRIKESCGEMANDDILRRDGVLARITGFDEGRTAYYAVMPNGHSTQLTFPSQEIFDIGDVLLVGKDFYTKVPPSVWPVKPRVGVIRRALEDCVVIETSDGLELLEGEYPVDIAPGNTVEFTDLFGIGTGAVADRDPAGGSPTMMTTSSSTASRRVPIRRSRSRRSVGMSGSSPARRS